MVRKGLVTILASMLLPATAMAGAGGISAAGMINLFPVGTFKVEGGGADLSEGTAFAYGFGAQVDYGVTDAISVGIAPRYILNVIASDAPDDADSASQLDILVRAQYNHALNEQIAAFGFLAPGYSIIMPPDDSDSAKGLVIGFGAGARYAINEKLFAQGEAGYQLGFQGLTVMDVDITTSTNYLHIGVGVGSHF